MELKMAVEDDAGAAIVTWMMPPPGTVQLDDGFQGEAKLSLVEGGVIIVRRRGE